jgi:hypothetical protein
MLSDMASVGVLQAVYNRGRPAGQPAEDVMVNVTHHALTSDDGWSETEMDDAATAYDAFFTSHESYISSEVSLKELRFYHFDPLNVPPRPHILDGVRTLNNLGTGNAATTLPPQDAVTITWRTSIRKRWGRIYLGGFAGNASSDGRILHTLTTLLADDAETLVNAFATAGTDMVVWAEGVGGETITEIEVDDVWDVQRRRRYDSSLFREFRTPA